MASPDGALRPFELGFARTELRRALADAVLRGHKTATASLREEYEPFADDPMPRVGDRGLLLGYDEPLGVVETTEVRVVPAGQVDLDFARDEGEGFASVAEWRAAHDGFWSGRGYAVADETLVVCERFRLVSR